METQMKSLQVKTKTNDVDSKGRVTVAVNGIGIEDSQGDISMPGSFDATLKLDIDRMKWLYNHDITQLLGVPLEGAEIDDNLVMVGQLNMEKQLCRDVYADYKLFAENDRTLEHSIGVIAVRRDDADKRKVLEWKMFEYSTLSFLGANPRTFLVDLKSATRDQVKSAVEFLQKALEQPEYSDLRLNKMDMELRLLLKSLNGGRIATCPCCGAKFDYDEQDEITFGQQVRDTAMMYARWLVEDIVYDEVQNLEPELREQVLNIIDTLKANKIEINEKSITDAMSYVRCPECWARVYQCDIAGGEKSDKKMIETKPQIVTTAPKSFSNMLASITSKM